MFWVIYALMGVFEEYLEFLVRWFPGYYYMKAGFIVLISVPALRITHLVFNDGVVVLFTAMDRFRRWLEELQLPTPREVAVMAPFVVVAVLFPNMLDQQEEEEEHGDASDVCTPRDPVAVETPVTVPQSVMPPAPPKLERGEGTTAADSATAITATVTVDILPLQLRRRISRDRVAPAQSSSPDTAVSQLPITATAVQLEPPHPSTPPVSPMKPHPATSSGVQGQQGQGQVVSPLRIDTRRRLAALAPYIHRVGDSLGGGSQQSRSSLLRTATMTDDGSPANDGTGSRGAMSDHFSSSSSSRAGNGLHPAIDPVFSGTSRTQTPETTAAPLGSGSPLKFGIMKSLLDFDLKHKPTNAVSRDHRRTTLLAANNSAEGSPERKAAAPTSPTHSIAFGRTVSPLAKRKPQDRFSVS
jgi:hypothetical protein